MRFFAMRAWLGGGLALLLGASEAVAAELAAPLKGGVIAVWLGDRGMDREAILKMPAVKGGQVVVQWAQVERAKGHYDFTLLDQQLADYAARGLPVTLQLNGNLKPHYLFDEVPYVKERGEAVPAFRQVQNREGTLMYWHPAHERAYVNCLAALRDHLVASPDRARIIGLRMNFNPFGTEGINIFPAAKAAEYAPRDRWIRPAGCDPTVAYDGFNLPQSLDYVRRIMRKHIELFAGVVPMFIRATVDSAVLADFKEYLANGTFGIFETGSSFAPFGVKTEDEEQWILRYCKPGQTLGYAESIADSWGTRTVKDTLLLPPPQACYWRVLCDLHKGVSYLAFYGKDLNVALTGNYQASSHNADGSSVSIRYSDRESGFDYRGEFGASLEFANRYAGQHASPETSPGAWIALRASDAVANARDTRQKLKVFTGDYTFLMERLPDESTGVTKLGPEEIRYGGYARRLGAEQTMRLKIDERFRRSLKGASELRVIYFDDAAGGELAIAGGGQSRTVALQGGNAWRTAVVELARPDFAPHEGGGDITLVARGQPVCLHLVELVRK